MFIKTNYKKKIKQTKLYFTNKKKPKSKQEKTRTHTLETQRQNKKFKASKKN